MRFVFVAWLASRAVIIAAFFVAGAHPLASAGNWDGAWYGGSIAQHGYGYAQIGTQRDIAFFPLFPMLASLVLRIGIGWPLAGVLVNNAAFFGALACSTASRANGGNKSRRRAGWSHSLAPGHLAVREPRASRGASIGFSARSRCGLRFDRNALPAAWRAAASAASAIGIALAGALVIDALVHRRSLRDVASAALAFAGIGGFILFCYLRFGDPLAFAHAEHGWRTGGIDLARGCA